MKRPLSATLATRFELRSKLSDELPVLGRVGGLELLLQFLGRRRLVRLQAAYESLQAACCTNPDALIRDSCVILTQVYAAFDRTP